MRISGFATLSMTIKRRLLLSLLALVWAAPGFAQFELTELAPGVYVHYGQIADTDLANGGDIANVGVVVGERCAAVIDSGGSFLLGQAFREAIRSHTKVPICAVIATHMHPDHLLGHAAFLPDHPDFIAAEAGVRALMVRKEGYLSRQKSVLKEGAQGTELVLPTKTVKGVQTIDLGGRTLTLKTWKTAHTDNDLTVKDSQTGTLFTGDLLFVEHLPVIDGSLRGWLSILPLLQAEVFGPVVAGHGRVDSVDAAFQKEGAYLSGVAAEVRAALKAHKTLAATVNETKAPQDWALTDLYHRRNVTAAYAELEWED